MSGANHMQEFGFVCGFIHQRVSSISPSPPAPLPLGEGSFLSKAKAICVSFVPFASLIGRGEFSLQSESNLHFVCPVRLSHWERGVFSPKRKQFAFRLSRSPLSLGEGSFLSKAKAICVSFIPFASLIGRG